MKPLSAPLSAETVKKEIFKNYNRLPRNKEFQKAIMSDLFPEIDPDCVF